MVQLDALRRLGNTTRPGLGDDLAARVLRDPQTAAPLIDPQLDNNLISALANPADDLHPAAVTYARANQAAGLSVNRAAYREFLARFSKYQFDQLRAQYGIRLIREISFEELDAVGLRLQNAFAGTGRKIKPKDARVAASAFLTGERLATSDELFFKRARDLGLSVEFVGTGAVVTRAATYLPTPVVIP